MPRQPGGQLRPFVDVLVPLVLRGFLPIDASIGAIERRAYEVPDKTGVLFDCRLYRLIYLRPLRVPQSVEVFRLPSPLRTVAQDRIAFDPCVGSTLPFETGSCRRLGAGKLSTKLFKALISPTIQRPDTVPIKSHSVYSSRYNWLISQHLNALFQRNPYYPNHLFGLV